MLPSFPRSAWECRLRRSASFAGVGYAVWIVFIRGQPAGSSHSGPDQRRSRGPCQKRTRSVQDGIPTQSVGTRRPVVNAKESRCRSCGQILGDLRDKGCWVALVACPPVRVEPQDTGGQATSATPSSRPGSCPIMPIQIAHLAYQMSTRPIKPYPEPPFAAAMVQASGSSQRPSARSSTPVTSKVNRRGLPHMGQEHGVRSMAKGRCAWAWISSPEGCLIQSVSKSILLATVLMRALRSDWETCA